ncbi:MAG: aminoacyl-tRNA hydrolase [Ignavibacteria bacterium]|nr:aminoacyl-tRNA hydrolase [Ignavibacteria bacterium]
MDTDIILKEAVVKAVRSSGKGGQNVNKVSTKVEIYFNIPVSEGLTDAEKEIISAKLKKRLDKNGTVKISAQTERSQLKNRKAAEEKLLGLLRVSAVRPKRRVKTAVPESSSAKRLTVKKIISEKKKSRRKDIGDIE